MHDRGIEVPVDGSRRGGGQKFGALSVGRSVMSVASHLVATTTMR
jgi:hypothetical protein